MPSSRDLRIFVSGVQSGPDPYSGIGIACSLRLAFPKCKLVAVDQSAQSSGLNWPDFDEWIVLPNRADMAHLCASLAPNEYFIPCVDEEIHWLANKLQPERRVFIPGFRCLRHTLKPARTLARFLEVKVPPSILTPARRKSLEKFLEKCGPYVWRKGRLASAERVRRVLSDRYFVADESRSQVKNGVLQAHVEGSLEELAFAACQGRFINGIWMLKQGVTSKGKTWSGVVKRLSDEWRSRIEAIARRFSWHGAGTFEFIRDSASCLWLIDINPRFPAWIHGATLCGVNLPAELLSAASGARVVKCRHENRAFTRAVVEIAVHPQLESQLRPNIVD
jgi:diaminopimelate decarboxylase